MTPKETYLQKILQAKDHIHNGDIYQLNLSHQMTAALPISPFELYQKLRTQCPVPYAAYINTGTHHILSASPESLFKTDGTTITTRPIKGTIKRGLTQEQDDTNKAQLQSSQKDQAELMMITDLKRNDLGKICHFGSVKVPQLKTLETYPNVHHLVSTITGDLLLTLTLTDILQALFPGGSITGAPKQKSMEIINQLEPTPRNIYTGSIGYYDITQKSEFNIAIRTMYTLDGTLHFHSGGGITADSNPDQEWEETLTKASSIINTLTT
jgi:para-aminobenzoate synthetase component 1